MPDLTTREAQLEKIVASLETIAENTEGGGGGGGSTKAVAIPDPLFGSVIFNITSWASNASITVPINIPLAQGDVLEVKRLTGYMKAYLHAYALR